MPSQEVGKTGRALSDGQLGRRTGVRLTSWPDSSLRTSDRLMPHHLFAMSWAREVRFILSRPWPTAPRVNRGRRNNQVNFGPASAWLANGNTATRRRALGRQETNSTPSKVMHRLAFLGTLQRCSPTWISMLSLERIGDFGAFGGVGWLLLTSHAQEKRRCIYKAQLSLISESSQPVLSHRRACNEAGKNARCLLEDTTTVRGH
ncbi:hypothetical protein B0I37DRAFT_4038 [Chaetomium sp. MPI-CAGE-AT-0009]|nr:hypothetical protein B0I37DRAFT_4038 [Chaetomium sp. MPI-CAGE-AT-0009]